MCSAPGHPVRVRALVQLADPELRPDHQQRPGAGRAPADLLIDYQNTVLKAQQEVENGLAAFLQGRQAG